ncbi:MAG: hypothetical protein F6K11_22970 [Leptolyngbya sp. SIO3F4]|nr:hypothetical protein [Leptolyngbya sp. SIO3F4]
MKKLLGGIGLLGLSGFMLLGFAKANLSDQSTAVKAITFGIGVGLPLAGGIGLVRSHRQDQKRIAANQSKAQLRTLQSDILKLAKVNQGKLTEIEVISELGIEQAVVNKALTKLCQQDLAEIEMTDSGLLVYVFPDIQQLPHKHYSRGLIDA